MWILNCLLLFIIIVGTDSWCAPFSYDWESWSGCSRSCGGGSRSRIETSCVRGDKGKTQTKECANVCYHGYPFLRGGCQCPSWREDPCCTRCLNIYISNCKPNQQECGGFPDNIKCTECHDPFFSAGYGHGCQECRRIDNCQHRHCTQYSNTRCIKCEDDNVFFKRREADTKCERLCAWNNHFCWPGTCGVNLTKECNCFDGFKLTSNTSETSCQPSKRPSIETCFTTFAGSDGDKKQSQVSQSSAEYQYYLDVYGNFQVKNIEYDFLAEFTITLPTLRKPAFIKETNFGITDATIYLEKVLFSGKKTEVGKHNLVEDKNNSTLASRTFATKGYISTSSDKFSLQNGEWLCARYESLGGGYLKSIDTSKSTHVELQPTPYQKTNATKSICYRYDDEPPVHCKAIKNCSSEPLFIIDKVTRMRTVPVYFQDWFDPSPSSADPSRASSIESYQITIHNTYQSKVIGGIDNITVNFNVTSVILSLPPDSPRLYCIVLEVKDIADNVRQARRFVLYDNTSFVEKSSIYPINVKSASPKANYIWQTHHNDICIDWKEHFFNKEYQDGTHLNPIEPDPIISGVYDQVDGLLPLTGTANVHGIVNFKYAWSLNNNTMSKDIIVPNLFNQSYCKHFDLKDGESYTMKIVAIDIANNTCEDNTTVHIDRTVPHIKNIWLQKDNHKRLFVHDSKELSTMSLYFEAIDPHSGILNVNWTFGTTDSGTELLTGMLKPQIVNGSTCPTNSTTCYCPDIGYCEIFNYEIPLNRLVSANKNFGNHNRNYYFSIKATNNALLKNIEHVEILVDYSPPEPGAVFEGPAGSSDIDYTSDHVIIANWHGFIDHESGIKLYRVGIARRCLSKGELMIDNGTEDVLDFEEVSSMIHTVSLIVNGTGKFFVTVIAVNNAIDPSEAVCSDGITRDISPPAIRNLTLRHAGVLESIGCTNGTPWFIDAWLTKTKLHPTPICLERCLNQTDDNLLHVIPQTYTEHNEHDISDFLCQTLPHFTERNFIYIPDDYIFMQWTIDDKESQLNDIFVGFGRDASEQDTPSIIDYTTTNRKTYFKRSHEGIGSKTLFYIFLKAISKSGLSKVVTVGPIVIDLTPPKYTNIPTVNVSKDFIRVIWDNDTFYDEEQVSPITHIQFQFATTEGVVTPMHEWQLETSIECGRCITYPLHQLQNQDNGIGQEFFVKLFVYNIAGHFIEVHSVKFQLPSKYPPGHALVYDIDPDSRDFETFPKDVDIHYTPNTLCVKWNGFKHHENVHIEIGIGLDNSHDNVVNFHTTNKTNEACINSTKVNFGRTYYVLLRAKCSGGETISSSDGVKLINITSLLASLKVGIGESCKHVKHTIKSKYIDGFISVSQPLHIGKDYSVFVSDANGQAINANFIELTSNDIVTRKRNKPAIQFISFVPYVEWPVFKLNIHEHTSSINISSLTIYVSQCGYGNNYITSLEQVSIYWYLDAVLPLSFRYEVRIASVSNRSNASVSSIALLVSHDHSKPNNKVTFRNLNLNTHDSNYAEVSVCINKKCFGPVCSEEMMFIADMPIGTIDDTIVNISHNGSCTEITAIWNEFLDESGMMFYTWSLSKDVETSRLLTDWRVISDTGKATYEVNECLQLPVYVASTMFMCVRGYSNAQTMGQICSKVNFAQYNSVAIDTVYDFDVSITEWENIKNVLYSYGIGEKMSLLHNNELNIGTIDTVVAGAMVYETDRTVAWFLMTLPYTPISCKDDDRCITEISTDVGYVVFSRDNLSPNSVYFICVYSNETRVNREYHIEVLAEIKSCSNGFLIDTIAPEPGSVMVKHNDGYITTHDLDSSWEDFTDNIDATVFGFPRSIEYYQIRVGSYPGSDDIVHTRNTSDRTYSFKNLDIKDGAIVYVSVTAFDYSGQSTTVSSDGYYVDTSPPSVGDIILSNDIVDQIYSTSNNIGLHLRNFNDRESGIDHFEISIGSSVYNDEVIPTETVVFDTGDIELHVQENNTVDGHRYYVGVAAFNRAGLQSMLKTVPIIFDKSPPEAGQVMDGNWMLKKDADFQTRTYVIEGHWTGFSDQQSGISHYSVGLGTRPNVDDIRAMRFVGLVKDISWRGSFIVGQKYYITVVACNGAGVCRPVSSDGIIVDNSPPIGGLVRVGSESRHQQFLTHKTSVRIHWAGFEDPHSGIEKFEVCIGGSPYSCDILPFFACLLQSSIIKSGVNLPLGKYMYATVIAFNKVGMNVTQTSDYFIVDTSAPLLVTKPTFLLDYNANDDQNIQWEKSVLRVHWEFTDKESPIVRHVISLQTHHDGHSPVENMAIGNVNKVTINLAANNWLHNGDTYTVLITCCNVAGHCTTERSTELLIDSTPPFLGGFKPPLTWENIGTAEGNVRSQLNLTWYGFQDEESSIENYYLTASKSYSGQELTGGILKVAGKRHNSFSEVTKRIHLTEALLTDDVVVIAIWAENKAGLNSTIGRISVNVLTATNHNTGILKKKGILEIQKHSCDVHNCNKACTCAILGQACEDISYNKSCRPINDTQADRNITYQSVSLSWGLEHSPQSITASSACLTGHWRSHSSNLTQRVVRYEWSAGLVDQPIGEGIFDLNSERPWNDVGLHEHFIYCLPTNRLLLHGEKYVFYVRAWYDFDVYIEYMSGPIVVDNTAPTVSDGKFVKDSDSSCLNDVDYIDSTDTMTGCWNDVFGDQQGQIIYYTVSLGTSPKADDTLVTTHVFMNTSFTLDSVNLRHGTTYFFTVTAYNNVGIHKTAVSDGFIVDSERPKEGVIFNTMFHRNELFQSSQNSLSISWHGFEDHYSGIHSYFVAFVEEAEANLPNVKFINIGLLTSYTFSNIHLAPGVSYVGIVKAMDAAGHFSTEVITIGKTVDITPPQGYECTEFELLEEFNQTTFHELDKNFTFTLNLTKESLYVVRGSLRTDDKHLTTTFTLDRFELRLPITLNHDGLRQVEYSFLYPLSKTEEIVLKFNSHSTILGTASMNRCTNMVRNKSKAVSARQIGPNTISVNVLVIDKESSIHEVNVGVGSTKGGFQIHALSPIHGNHGIINVNAPHATPLYVTAIAENYCGLKSVFHAEPIVVDHTAPEVYDVAIKVDMTNGNRTSVGLTSIVMAEWKIRELESGVKACHCSIGNSKHSTNIADVWKSNNLHSCRSRDLELQQGSIIYVTVRCVNDVELMSETVSKPVYAILQPPKTDTVHVSFVELNTDVSNPATDFARSESRYMQTNDSHIQIQWSGFTDTFLIDHYEYRLFGNATSVVEWTSTRHKSMATITGYPFVSGDWYTAEVKAVTHTFASDVVRASLLIFKDQPKLSGTPVSINRSGRTLNIDWSEVFQTFESGRMTSLYSLAIGSRPGFNDVKDELLTIEQSLDIEIPESTVVSAELKELFITITCYLSNGMTNVYEANYKI